MTWRRTARLAVGLACLYLTVLGFLVGVAVERIRFDATRASVLDRLTKAEHRVRARLMDLEGDLGPFVTARGPAAGRDTTPVKPGS
jgi:hypothetical protein